MTHEFGKSSADGAFDLDALLGTAASFDECLDDARQRMEGAHRSPAALLTHYRMTVPHGSQDVSLDSLSNACRADAQALQEEFDRADSEILRRFAVLLASNAGPDDLPFAIAGKPIEIILPGAEDALSILVSEENWAGMSDTTEAETARLELSQRLGWLAVNAKEHDLAAPATIAGYRRLAGAMPAVAALVALDTFGLARNARSAIGRVVADLEAGRADALTEGLARAVSRWIGERVYEDLRPEDVTAMRAKAGLSQQALADAVGVERRHMIRLEKGETKVSADLGKAIALACAQAMREGN